MSILMAILDILTFPDANLRIKAKPVLSIDDSTKELVNDMFETMYARDGIGLAATQVNVNQRIFITDLSGKGDSKLVFINPEITASEGECTLEEGCLSFPGVYAKVTRPEKITIQAQNLEGETFSRDSLDYEARCFLHELDHLNGIVYFDYLSPIKQKMLTKKMQKYTKLKY